MKKLLLVLLFSSAYLIIAQTDPNLKWLHPTPQGNQIAWIKMWDDNNWYLGGDEGMFLKTSDAGKSWTSTNMAGWANPSYPGTYANNITQACWFFDKNVGIAGGLGRGIVRTTDAGTTWDTIPIISGQGRINAFSFINNNIGYLAGNALYGVMKTTDGGLTWAATPTPLPASTGYSIYASDANNLIVCGASGNVYISNDAGNNWTTNNIGSIYQITA
ncbi:MAG: YCF48-related protein, partial [Ignavibacteriaceae bacterium]|nr:YCF48-related protein [Ignavibacteriaceae bacterium]